MRVKRGVTSHKRHKKVMKQTKGMQHARRSSIKLGRQGVIRSLQYAYRDRRNKKRDFRQLWITRINAAVREHGVSYSSFIASMKEKNVTIDRKILAELAVSEPKAIEALVKLK
ncbi:MAG: 50S ribosomal protein L20 [Chryseobacterium sp.]|nr:MAG: 50S ribosomal protein L20 [Chryseobacterium sp.]